MNVAFIPVRGGSTSIPLKNIKMFCGKPLVFWTLNAACQSKYVDKVYVSTDSEIIKSVVEKMIIDNDICHGEKVKVIGRSAESSTNTASTEMAMLEFAEKNDFDSIILIQATSPMLKTKDINHGFEEYTHENVDSVLSVVKQKRFIWKSDEEKNCYPVNYDYNNRPRRQEFEGFFVENGAFYITSRRMLLQTRNRLCGRVRCVEMDETSYFEIDEAEDWKIAESIMYNSRSFLCDNHRNIKLFISDCDGCLTDGGMYYSEKGDEIKKFNTKDGMAFKILRNKGILTGIITGEDMQLNKRRAEKLRIDFFEGGCTDKAKKIREICKLTGISLQEVCYVGDDLNDLESLSIVGFSCAPADAIDTVKMQVDYVSKAMGGRGAIREIVDYIVS